MTTSTAPRALRDYQSEAVDAVIRTWGNDIRRTGVVLPTGTGKSTVIAALAGHCTRMGLRTALVAHRAELLGQMADTYSLVNPDLDPCGMVRAEHDQSDAQVIAASLQTLGNDERHRRTGDRQVVIWDEVHHAGAPSWTRAVENYDDPFLAGFTATLRREDGKALRSIVDTVAYERSLRWAIDKEFLVKPRGLSVVLPELDLSTVTVRAGDYADGELAEIMGAETDEIVRAIATNARDRRLIVFAAGVDNAHIIADELRIEYGITAEAVTGGMGHDERAGVYDRFRSGRTQMMVTVMVLTEGADFPMCDGVALARPTRSQNLYSQMVGRALRPYPGKTDALVLDLVGTSRVLSLVTISSLDIGAESKRVTPDGDELPPEDDDIVGLPGGGGGTQMRWGPLEVEDFELLSDRETQVNWLVTPGGHPFVQPEGEKWCVFLWKVGYDADGELYRVGRMSTQGRKDGGWIGEDERPWPLAVAKEIAENVIWEAGAVAPNRDQRWRRNLGAPSAAQLSYARSLRIADADRMSKARLSDEISRALVGSRIDIRPGA